MDQTDSNRGFAPPRAREVERAAALVAELIATVVLVVCTVAAITVVSMS
ncbi:MAG: hypothetical protein ACR2K5_04755 [Pseudolabrys sp.]